MKSLNEIDFTLRRFIYNYIFTK